MAGDSIPRLFLNNNMDKTSYNHLAARLNQVQCFYNAATAENEQLKTNVRAFKDAYAKTSRRAKKAEKELAKARETVKKLAGQLATANINLIPKY